MNLVQRARDQFKMSIPGSDQMMQALDTVVTAARDFWILFGPGGKTHPGWFLEHQGHLVIEGVLVVIILYLFLQHSFKPRPRNDGDQLTEKVRDPNYAPFGL